MNTPAIVLGCHKIGLGIIKALGYAQIPVVAVYYGSHDIAHYSRYVHKKVLCPDPGKSESDFVTFLEKLCYRFPESVIIPSDDATLVSVSKFKTQLSASARIAAPEWRITDLCIDKKKTYALADSIGVRAPKTVVPRSEDEALCFAEKIQYPCLIKPCVSHTFFYLFRRKMITVRNPTELRDAFARAQAAGMEVMVQELIPGDDTHGVNYNSFWIQGIPVVELTAEKLRLSPRGTGFPCVVENKFIPQVLDPGRKLLTALSYHGFACIEFKKDSRNGEYVLMEINPRLNLSLLLSVKTGVNFASMVYNYETKKQLPLPIPPNAPYQKRTFWIDAERDTKELFKEIKHGKLNLLSHMFPYLQEKVFLVFSIYDPVPFFVRLFSVFLFAFDKIHIKLVKPSKA